MAERQTFQILCEFHSLLCMYQSIGCGGGGGGGALCSSEVGGAGKQGYSGGNKLLAIERSSAPQFYRGVCTLQLYVGGVVIISL